MKAEPLSFAAIAEQHLDDVLAYLVYLTADHCLAEDLTVETFERALRRWNRFDPRRGGARTWLCQLARSAALDHFRSEARRLRREERYAVRELREVPGPSFGEGLSPELEHEPSDKLVGVELDGEPAPFPPGDPPLPADLLSDELDKLSRDPVYEAAVLAAVT